MLKVLFFIKYVCTLQHTVSLNCKLRNYIYQGIGPEKMMFDHRINDNLLMNKYDGS